MRPEVSTCQRRFVAKEVSPIGVSGRVSGVALQLDHTILEVTDHAESVAFYRDILGLDHEGSNGPFEVMLITPDLALDLAEADEPASRHLAFAMDRITFEATFERIRTSGTVYGNGPSRPDNMKGPEIHALLHPELAK